MIRWERMNRAREQAGVTMPPLALHAALFTPSKSRSERLDLTPRPSSTVTIGGQTYRGFDNGRADVLVPIDDP